MVRGKRKSDGSNADAYIGYPKEEWERKRPIIVQLYQRDPELKITEILDELYRIHAFKPSPAALSRHINEIWGLHRYRTEMVMRGIIRSGQRNQSTNVVRIRGRDVDINEAYRWFREQRQMDRNAVDTWQLHYSPRIEPLQTSSPGSRSSSRASPGSDVVMTPESNSPIATGDLEAVVAERYPNCRTHESAAIPQAPRPSSIDRASLNLFRSAVHYFGVQLRDTNRIETLERTVDALCPSTVFGGLFLKFHNELTQHRYGESYSTQATIFFRVRPLLETQDPRMLIHLLEGLAFSRANGYEELALRVAHQFFWQAHSLWGPEHDLTIFCGALLHASRDEQDAMIAIALECIVQQYLDILKPPRDLETSRVLLTRAMVLKHLGRYQTAIKFLGWLLPMYQRFYGENSGRLVQCLVDEAHIHLALRSYATAGTILHKAGVLAENVNGHLETAESKMRVLVGRAVQLGMEGDLLEKRKVLQVAQQIGRCYNLPSDHWAIRDAEAREIEDFHAPVNPDRS